MNPLVQLILLKKYKGGKVRQKKSLTNLSPYQKAKNVRSRRIITRRHIRSIILILMGILSASFGLRGFLIPNKLIDGGVTGISLLANILSGFSLSFFLILINAPFIALGYFQSGKIFAIKSISSIVGLAVAVAFIDFPIITSDKLLVAVFGGFFLGAGIGLAIRGGSVLDGTEILAVFLNQKTGFSVGDIIFIFNIIIFSFAGWFLGVETALYSILIYLAASKTVDFFLQGIDEYTGVTIISRRSKTVKLMLMNKFNKDITIYQGKNEYLEAEHNYSYDTEIIYTVVTRLDLSRLYDEIYRIDPDAFVITTPIKEVRGKMFKQHF
ncbi:MAG: YitT family protein [Bacteroidales bacterium]|nr:YitT family protein [Bacteroidales bacterium]